MFSRSSFTTAVVKELHGCTARSVEEKDIETVNGMKNEILIGIMKLLFYVSFRMKI